MFAVRSMKLLPAASVMAWTFRRSKAERPGTYSAKRAAITPYPAAPIRKQNRALAAEYDRIAAADKNNGVQCGTASVMNAGRDERAVRRWTQTASCLRAFAPRSSHPNTANRPYHRRRPI